MARLRVPPSSRLSDVCTFLPRTDSTEQQTTASDPSRIVGQSPHDLPPLGDLDGPGLALGLSVVVVS